jgi:hypothetical protein
VRLERLGQLRNPVTSLGNEPVNNGFTLYPTRASETSVNIPQRIIATAIRSSNTRQDTGMRCVTASIDIFRRVMNRA